jgi:hypothetical protein
MIVLNKDRNWAPGPMLQQPSPPLSCLAMKSGLPPIAAGPKPQNLSRSRK